MRKSVADKEKEKTEKMKELRRELEQELAEQLSSEELAKRPQIDIHQVDLSLELEPEKAKQVLEAILFAASKPMTVSEIRKIIRGVTPKQVETMIQEIRESLAATGRSIEIVEIAGGYEVATRKDFAPWILRAEIQKKAKQATQSALETLAILAYKQPITRAEIEELRGVDVSGVINTLMERNFIKIVGKKEVPGRPFLYGTTEKFLDHFGLKDITSLPNIDEIKQVVENSVKKEELLGTTKIIPVEEGVLEGQTQVVTTEAKARDLAEETEMINEVIAQETELGSE